MSSRLSVSPPTPGSHPVVARCRSSLEASQVESVLRLAGVACIRMDREAASLLEGRVSHPVALILVSRDDYARAKDLLAAQGQLPVRTDSAEPA